MQERHDECVSYDGAESPHEHADNCPKASAPHLRSRWRDRVVKLKEKGRIADFKDITEFVESAAESANDPIYGSQALNKSEQKHKASSIRDSTKRTQLPNQRSSSLATNVNVPPASVSLRKLNVVTLTQEAVYYVTSLMTWTTVMTSETGQ